MRFSSRFPVAHFRWVVLVALTMCLGSANCGGGGGGHGVIQDPFVASFTVSGTPQMPNTVRLTGAATADVVTVDVMVGATTSNDLYSFAFDLVLGDPTVAQYIVGSATIGDALTLGSGQQGQALAVQSGAMITVGVTKLGGGSGNGVDASEHAIVHLDFRVLKSGMTSINLSGSPPNPPAALDSTGTVVGSVHFDSAPAMIAGS